MKTFVILLLLANLLYWGWNSMWQEKIPAALIDGERAEQVAPVPFEQAPTRLKLVSERALEAGDIQSIAPEVLVANDSVVEPEKALESTGPLVPPVPWCAQSDNFSSEAQLSMLAAELNNLGYGAEVVAGDVPVSFTYWVHMPDFATEQDALRQLAELKEKGIDSYYMRSGELAGGISLGVFSRRERAELVRSNLGASGYRTEIGQIARQERRYWLNLRMSDRAGLDSPQWAAFSEALNPLNLTEKVCEVVASETQFP